MTDNEVIEEVATWHVRYGYLNIWSGQEKVIRKGLPDRFEVVYKGVVLRDRHFDGFHRVYLGREFMKQFTPGQKLRLIAEDSRLLVKEI